MSCDLSVFKAPNDLNENMLPFYGTDKLTILAQNDSCKYPVVLLSIFEEMNIPQQTYVKLTDGMLEDFSERVRTHYLDVQQEVTAKSYTALTTYLKRPTKNTYLVVYYSY